VLQIGLRRGKLEVVAEELVDGVTYWKCLCDCGGTRLVVPALFKKPGNYSKCTKCILSLESNAIRDLLHRYKAAAEHRKLSFVLSEDEFRALILDNCHYCNTPPAQLCRAAGRTDQQFRLKYNGIDRVENTKGYETGNVVTCCYSCNKAKGNMSTAEFLAWIRRVYAYSINNAVESAAGWRA
jgi:5-methylcytosine-specific restriction endonuclease McrA